MHMPSSLAASGPSDFQNATGSASVGLAALSAVTRRIQIPELLSIIFDSCKPDTLAVIARVCHSWSELALNRLWMYSLRSAVPLLEVLTPGIRLGEHWSDSLDGANWVRFRCYATRVRYLHHADGDKATKQLPNLDEQYVTRLSCVKPQDYGPLLPRLQCLHWSVTNDDHGFGAMLEFLSPSIQELLLRSSSSDRNPEAFVNILSRLTERTDIRLTHLTITKRRHHPNIDIAIASYLESRSEITNLKLGVIEAGGRIAIELGKLSHLQSLYLLPSYSDHEQLENFCSTLAESCKLLHTLSLLFLKGVGDGVLPFHPLRPLLRLRGLVHIALVHRVQLKIEESDIAAMGEAWPLARSLDLARLAKEASRIPARLLATFAKSFNPALTHLYVILDFGGVPTTPPSSIIRFQSLHLLDVGVSTVLKNQVGPAANLLASICPAGTYITFDKEKLGKDDRRVWREVKRAVRNAAASPIVVE